MLGRRRADTTGTPFMTILPQGTWAPWTAMIGTTAHARVGQDLGGLVGLERHRAQSGGEGVAAMPQPPEPVQLEAAPILLGVDHEYPTGPDHQVIDVGAAARAGQVMQDRPSLPLQRVEQPGGAPLPRRPPPPGDGLRAGSEPQPPASRRHGQRSNHQSQPRHQLAAKDSPTDTDPNENGDPPGQRAGPDGPLGRPQPPPGRLGGTARPANAGPPVRLPG